MSAQVVKVDSWSDSAAGIIEGVRPLIPPGDYQLAFVGHHTMIFCRAPKVALRFRVIDQGPHFGTELERFYNVRRLVGKQGKNGKFKIGASSDLLLEFCRCAPDRVARLDRLPITALKQHIVIGEVHTVDRNRNQVELPEPLRYSVIKALKGVAS